MTNPHLVCARMHLESKPGETRTLDELEAYYRSLSMSSPFAPLVLAMQQADAALDAKFETSFVLNRARR